MEADFGFDEYIMPTTYTDMPKLESYDAQLYPSGKFYFILFYFTSFLSFFYEMTTRLRLLLLSGPQGRVCRLLGGERQIKKIKARGLCNIIILFHFSGGREEGGVCCNIICVVYRGADVIERKEEERKGS